MHSSDNPQAFQNALYDPSPPRSRPTLGVAASIWAPQPQPSEATWPKTLDSFSRVAEREFDARSNGNGNRPETNGAAVVRREDVFGPAAPPPPPASGAPRPKDIGAIGDGRKKNSPGFDDTHVEQLLRTLNLNSPAPYAKKQPPPTLCLDTSPSSPDFSPASATSSLMTPTDSPSTRSFDPKFLHSPSYDLAHTLPSYLQPQSSLLFEHAGNSPGRAQDGFISSYRSAPTHQSYPPSAPAASHTHASAGVNNFPFFEPFAETMPASYSHSHHHHPLSSNNHTQSMPRSLPVYNTNMNHSPPTSLRRIDSGAAPRTLPPMDWRLASGAGDWLLPTDDKFDYMHSSGAVGRDEPPPGPTLHNSFMYQSQPQQLSSTPMHSHEPINFLSLLHPSSSPPYHVFVERIIKSSDQQASIFLQQKLKVADLEERAKIVDAICARGFEMMAHRFGNWAVQRCLEAASVPEERRKMVACMRGRVVELATNCYGCHVLQKALDCEEDIRLLIVSELLLGDPAQTLVNKHASHVWSKIMELSWTPPAPPIFAYVNKSLKGKWASLACHETGSLVVQHAFENLEADAKDGIVDELIGQGGGVFADVAKNQWGSYCVQHILEHGSDSHREQTLQHLLDGLLEFATSEQGAKSVTKALKEGGKATLDRIVERMCEPAKGLRRAMIVDLALSVTGSQLIASVLPTADKDQRAMLYECIRGHIVTLRGCKTGSKVIWLFDRMRAYYGY